MSMNYLDQFQKHLSNTDYPKFLMLWEEYCLSDEVDGEELATILKDVKDSELVTPFGRHVEKGLILWEQITDANLKHAVFKLILDLASANDKELAEMAYNYLKERYKEDPYFNDKIRLIGLREKKVFQGAISNYELLTHMKKSSFVFHTKGWGVGEVMDISFIREELSLEFDCISGRKDLSFANAFNTLIPLQNDHFLALRFGDPDSLEESARKKPMEIIHTLLKDLGPQTAADIKEELCDLVIPEKEWARWWQMIRAKIKKDTLIKSPNKITNTFSLRKSELSHEDRLKDYIEQKTDVKTLVQTLYSFLRDFSGALKHTELRTTLCEKLKTALTAEELSDSEELEIHFLLKDLGQEATQSSISELIKRFKSPEELVKGIDIIGLKKRALMSMIELRDDWTQVFPNLFLTIEQNPLREFILSELLKANQLKGIIKKIEELITFPSRTPQALIWYFQKAMKNSELPLSDPKGLNRLFEAFLILLSQLEQNSEKREMVKKMYNFLTTARYNNVRKIFQHTTKDEIQEFLLLCTKCHCFREHDIKIFHSLAEVVHPFLTKVNKKYKNPDKDEVEPIWTTEDGYKQVKERIHHISTVETVDNAKEIEEARSHGDLRENSEFKFALERRDRLQGELKLLSDQFNKARILTKNDVSHDTVSVGVIVELSQKDGEKLSLTLLGPWEANPDQNILSFQSKLAQSLMGKKVGDQVAVQGKECTILSLHNYFNKD